jgi:leucyl-tRNA synthetase
MYQRCVESSEFESVHKSTWPDYDESLLVDDLVEIPVQVNGKLRASVRVSREVSGDKERLLEVVLLNVRVKKWLKGKEYKVIFVPGRLVNFVL